MRGVAIDPTDIDAIPLSDERLNGPMVDSDIAAVDLLLPK